MSIVAVGHTPIKMDRLLAMLPADLPRSAVFNGDVARPDALHVQNDPVGLDIKMYQQGLTDSDVDKFIFLNDDMIYLGPEFWAQARAFIGGEIDVEVMGVANLSHWIDYEKCNPKQKNWHQRRGRELQFLRTSAFCASRDYFDRVYKAARGNAQAFEKLTLRLAKSYRLIEPIHAYDSNIRPFLNTQ